jgi:hypothetical protein
MISASIEDTEESTEEPGPTSEAINALMSYSARLDAGERVDRDAFLAEHASCADELSPVLDAIERVRSIWEGLPGAKNRDA